MKHYLIRLDDACPTMNHKKWGRMESILDKYGVKPMVGVIPHNEDPKLLIDPEDKCFWDIVHRWEHKGWTIALHGYNHVYSTKDGGLNPLWHKSEFAGHTLEVQQKKIREGVVLFRKNGINPKYFFAPSHTFDKTTLTALREESDIRVISDTIATKPYVYKDFIIVPQFNGQCREIKFCGLFTFCLHPNSMNDSAFERTENFLIDHKDDFLSFDNLDFENIKEKSLIDKLLEFSYFTLRRLKGIK